MVFYGPDKCPQICLWFNFFIHVMAFHCKHPKMARKPIETNITTTGIRNTLSTAGEFHDEL